MLYYALFYQCGYENGHEELLGVFDPGLVGIAIDKDIKENPIRSKSNYVAVPVQLDEKKIYRKWEW